MVDMICLGACLAFVVVTTLAAVATTSASRTVRGIASKTVNGSFTAALVSVALAVWFFSIGAADIDGSAPRPNNTPKTLADQREHDPETLWVHAKGEVPSRRGQQARFHTPCPIRPPARCHPPCSTSFRPRQPGDLRQLWRGIGRSCQVIPEPMIPSR